MREARVVERPSEMKGLARTAREGASEVKRLGWRREKARGEAGTHIHFEGRSDWGCG